LKNYSNYLAPGLTMSWAVCELIEREELEVAGHAHWEFA
jgi:hypothetical protein